MPETMYGLLGMAESYTPARSESSKQASPTSVAVDATKNTTDVSNEEAERLMAMQARSLVYLS
jgi:hypothetical protein